MNPITHLRTERWFSFYKGKIYRSKPLDIHTAINNKVIIDKLITT